MIYEYAHIRIAEADRAAFEAAAPAARKIFLSVDGCREVQISRAVDQPGLYLLRIGWDSIEDHVDRFPQSAQAAELGGVIGYLFDGEPLVTHFHDGDLSV